MRGFRHFSLAFLLPFLLLCVSGAQQTVTVGNATVALTGPWKFHTGDNLHWAHPSFNDSSWQPVRTGESWETQGHRNYTGFGWYRTHIDFAASSHTANLALMLPRIEDAAEIYWNGRLVGGYGKVPPHPIWYDFNNPPFPFVFELGSAVILPKQNLLAIRVWKAPYAYLSRPDMGGIVRTPSLGNSDSLAAIRTAAQYKWLRANQYTFGLALISTIICLLALLGWLRDRRQWLLFWLAAYMARPLLLLLVERVPELFSWRTSYGWDGIVFSTTDAALWFLLLYLLGLRSNPRLTFWTRVFACIAIGSQILEGSLQLFDWTRAPRFFLAADVGLTIPSLFLQLFGIVLVAFAFRKRLDFGQWLVAVFALLVDAVPNAVSWFDLGNRWTHWTFAQKIQRPLFTIADNRFDLLTILTTLLLASIVYAVWRYELEQNRHQNLLEQEFHSAQEVQQILIPAHPPVTLGFSIETVYRPASEVGGDFFQILPHADGSLLIVAGDVSGKGLKAAMTVSAIIGALRGCAVRAPAEVLAYLNGVLHGQIKGFATCCVALIAPDGATTLANAGHIPPYLNREELSVENGLPVGIVADSQYQETRFRLAPGDRLMFVSDGVVEATNDKGELFGFDRTQQISGQDAASIAEAAQRFGQQDDITVVAVRFTGVPAVVSA